MYPDWPECAADLVPLPQWLGPKLGPFDFQGPQKIEFLEFLGEGLHAMVFKVRILGQVYALKVFRWMYDYYWLGSGDFINRENPEGLSAVYNCSDPFNNECRAFGRLQEAGCEELAVRCFGYVLLDEEHERAMMTKFNYNKFSFNGTSDDAGFFDEEQRLVYPVKNGRPPPFRCIVKAFGKHINVFKGDVLRQGAARQVFQSIIKLQKLGIIGSDTRIEQLIDDKLCDFSMAITLPHPSTNPELNPHLSPEMIHAMEKATFAHCVTDYLQFDTMIREWNMDYGRERGRLSIEAFPGRRGCCRIKTRYNLRGGTAAEGPIYTLVDPRRYHWTANQVSGGASALPASQRRHSGKISKVVAHQSVCSRDSKDLLRKPTARPDLWLFQCKEEDKEWSDHMVSHVWGAPYDLQWECKGGYLFPVKKDSNNIAWGKSTASSN
ncbi:kinetochore Sim4 complex subunit FTA2-domain-containing protein [Camillea tinctor]|nr:kinetochore Sim4 complex subunit FTA2-domain-containing protein [Camillea tinctor]